MLSDIYSNLIRINLFQGLTKSKILLILLILDIELKHNLCHTQGLTQTVLFQNMGNHVQDIL